MYNLLIIDSRYKFIQDEKLSQKLLLVKGVQAHANTGNTEPNDVQSTDEDQTARRQIAGYV